MRYGTILRSNCLAWSSRAAVLYESRSVSTSLPSYRAILSFDPIIQTFAVWRLTRFHLHGVVPIAVPLHSFHTPPRACSQRSPMHSKMRESVKS